MKTTMASWLVGLTTISFCSAAVIGTDKTLVSWVCLANTSQRGGSALTIQRDGQFDGIVFGEVVPGKWMAGSEGGHRTPTNQQASAIEKTDGKTLIQMAAVYKHNQISLYRNGEPYASCPANNIDLLSGNANVVVFGLSHEWTAGGSLQGAIEDARIFDRALTVDEIKQLQPNQPSAIKPYAWWTFEEGKETDRTGRFPYSRLLNGARIARGRLVLEAEDATLVACARPKPGYHLFHEGTCNGPFDPNAALYWQGRYHLHYIVWEKGGLSYAHVSSPDMVHWVRHPLTLTHEKMGKWLASGTCIVNKEGVPTIIYHGCDPKVCRHEEGIGQNCLGFAKDAGLENWEVSSFQWSRRSSPGRTQVRSRAGTRTSGWKPAPITRFLVFIRRLSETGRSRP